jgi:WD40 repeat protein
MQYSETVLSVRYRYVFKHVHLSAFGNFLVTCHAASLWVRDGGITVIIEIREVPSGKVLARMKETFDGLEVTALSLSPSGNYLVVLFDSTNIRCWKIQYP